MIKILKISILALILSTNALAGSDGELKIVLSHLIEPLLLLIKVLIALFWNQLQKLIEVYPQQSKKVLVMYLTTCQI